MAKSKSQKEQELTALTEKITKSKGVVFLQYLGLKVDEMQELRKQLRQADNELVVAKKTLLGLMLKQANLAEPQTVREMDGGVAVAFGYKDEISPAKILAAFAKKHEMVSFFGGVLEGKFVDAAKVVELSNLPSRLELLAKMIGSMRAPLSGMVNVLQGNLRGLVQVLNQIKEKKPA